MRIRHFFSLPIELFAFPVRKYTQYYLFLPDLYTW